MMPTGMSDEDSMPNFDESLSAPRDAILSFRVGHAWGGAVALKPLSEKGKVSSAVNGPTDASCRLVKE
jgi:hypothetical protein